jgi:DNA polymerase (family X)
MPVTTPLIPLGRAHMLASTIIRDARRAGLPAISLTPLGGLRRFAPETGEVALLAVAEPDGSKDVLDSFVRLPGVVEVTSRSPAHATVTTDRGSITLHVTSPDEAGAALVWHTGSGRHTQQLQSRARQQGLTFEKARLSDAAGRVLLSPTEQDVYDHIGLPYIAPELREGDGEIPAAERGELPALVAEVHIRGDLHMHSTWSDGRDTILDMVTTSRQLGYEYIAITDHSERSLASRKLSGSDIPRQRREIERVRTRVHGIHVLHGIEVDIMHDGSLDFDDAQLEGFDIVLASLHDHGGHDPTTLTNRYMRAIRHPLVNVITHPANRAPGRSPGYNVDFDVLFAAAAETGTAMEIDGAPGHLDLDGALARRAVALGVMVVIDSDCHRADALSRQMRFGLGTARRGWVGPEHVLNTRSIDSVREFVSRKRARR